jgi:hypothetical protein
MKYKLIQKKENHLVTIFVFLINLKKSIMFENSDKVNSFFYFFNLLLLFIHFMKIRIIPVKMTSIEPYSHIARLRSFLHLQGVGKETCFLPNYQLLEGIILIR